MIELWVAMVILFAFGLVYETFVIDRMNTNGAKKHPLTAIQVSIGVLVTIGGAWLVDGDCMTVSTLLLCFAASGLPMTIGDIGRWYEFFS